MSKFRISLIFPIVFISVVVALFSFSIQEAFTATPPTVTTDIATISSTQLQSDQATLNGNITATGGATVDQIQFVWSSTSGGPYTNTACSSSGTFTGAFSCNFTLTGIVPGNTNIFYYKAQAHNSAGWSDLSATNEKQVVIYLRGGGQQSFTTLPSTYTLTVSKTGTGSGTVTDTGINCGTDCSEAYNSGTSVTLTATPDANSTFAGWSGDCSGTGTCTLTMNANKSTTATFNSCDLNRTGDYTITKSMFGGGCCILDGLDTDINDIDYHLQAGNLTLQEEGCIQINANTALQFDSGKKINLIKPNIYILKSASNTKIIKQ